MKYNIGDKVRIKSLDWYNENKDEDGDVPCGVNTLFVASNKKYLGTIQTIERVFKHVYHMAKIDSVDWTDEMIECKVEEETKFGTASNPIEIESNANCLTQERVGELATKIDKELPTGNQDVWVLPDGYEFKDENGNVINAQKIVLKKKKPKYPKTYEECCEVLSIPSYYKVKYATYEHGLHEYTTSNKLLLLQGKLNILGKLLICRDAYWKLYGEETGKPWEPDYIEESWEQGSPIKYVIYNIGTYIVKERKSSPNHILAFPTAEMRDAFKENFDPDIENCKEFL